jgi:porphobilinogen synthase
MTPVHRPRRNRRSHSIRELVAETHLSAGEMIWPVFVTEGKNQATAISTMPGVFRYTPDLLLKEIAKAISLGVTGFALFPAIEGVLKDTHGKESLNKAGLLPKTVQMIKDKFPESTVITDVALDPYSSDGHDGVVHDGKILNDETVDILCQMAVVQAEAGADLVAPSDMMDGRVGAIRRALDQSGFHETGILAYSAKYASSFYGPFREALESAPKLGDKKTYQMDFRNAREAVHEARLDVAEGADIVMVKPALSYLDIIKSIKAKVNIPVAAYNVSGEYAMIKAADKAGMIDGTKAMVETLYSIKRAGADIILTYFALEMAKYLQDHALSS